MKKIILIISFILIIFVSGCVQGTESVRVESIQDEILTNYPSGDYYTYEFIFDVIKEFEKGEPVSIELYGMCKDVFIEKITDVNPSYHDCDIISTDRLEDENTIEYTYTCFCSAAIKRTIKENLEDSITQLNEEYKYPDHQWVWNVFDTKTNANDLTLENFVSACEKERVKHDAIFYYCTEPKVIADLNSDIVLLACGCDNLV